MYMASDYRTGFGMGVGARTRAPAAGSGAEINVSCVLLEGCVTYFDRYSFASALVMCSYSAQDARATWIKLILYGTLLENAIEFIRGLTSLQTHT